MSASSKTVLVTGGAGFIGSHLCDVLLARNHVVLCLDNLQTGSIRNVMHLLDHPNFSFIPQDIELALNSLDRIDEIYNLACPASPRHYQIDPVRTMRTNVVGAMNVLELARRTGARVLQASTSEVYGDPEVHPQPEEYRGSVAPFGPRACYDEGKRAAEALFFDYHRMYGVDIRIARIFNTYGPRMAEGDGRVVSNFVLQALRGEPITIYGTGEQSRSFCYVSDLVPGLVALMETGPEMRRPCNIGNPLEISVRALADTIVTLTGSRSGVVFEPLPVHDPVRRRPDIRLARTELNWEPIVGIGQGLQETIDYFRSITLNGVAGRTASRLQGNGVIGISQDAPGMFVPEPRNAVRSSRPLHLTG